MIIETMNYGINFEEYKILIVDDIETNVLLLKALLKKEKFQLSTALGGVEALRKVASESPDLILLDVMMPDIDGMEICRRLKSDDLYKNIPIIFLTALNSTADVVNAFQCGGSDYVSKPFNKEELLERIKHQINLIAANRTIEKQNMELIKTIEGRDLLYSIIAHDLRSPMASMKMSLNMLCIMSKDAENVDPFLLEMLQSSNQTAENLFDLLDNLLKWTKSHTGKLMVVYQEFTLMDIINGLQEIYQMMSLHKDITIEVDNSFSPVVRADIDMVKTIIRNLLSNALKFSPKGSSVRVSAKDAGDLVEVSVSDNGVGISKENMAKLFDLESQISTYGTMNEEGNGLGLMLTYDFVKKCGGDIWVESVEGEGSVFTFSIPKA